MKRTRVALIAFLAVLWLPLLAMNHKVEYKSVIDNTNYPILTLSLSGLRMIPSYVSYRIGFREEAIWLYEQTNYLLFGILDHPNYTYGKNGETFCRGESYLKDFQHINTGDGYAEEFAEYISKLSDIAAENDVKFLYVLCPDKKSVYVDSYVEGVNIDLSKTSRSELIMDALDRRGVDYYYPIDVLYTDTGSERTYNKNYDVEHWNDFGAFLTVQQIEKKLTEYDSRVNVASEVDYNIDTEIEPYMPTSFYRIDESVPKWTIRNETSIEDNLYQDVLPGTKVYLAHYTCDVDAPSILVFRDSYLDRGSKYIREYFSESTFASYGNLTSLDDYRKYIDIINPDIVIFENVERTLPLEILE